MLNSGNDDILQILHAKEAVNDIMIRSNSDFQLRDKIFYEMVIDEDELQNQEPIMNLFDVLHRRNLSQSKIKDNLHNQSTESPAQMLSSNMRSLNRFMFMN